MQTPQREQQEVRAGDADGETDRHLERELADDRPERPVARRRELDHPDHERDADRVVRAGLGLEDRAGAPTDLAPPEHGEHDGGVGGRERGAEQSRDNVHEKPSSQCAASVSRPAVAKVPITPSESTGRRGSEAAQADPRAAVEEDHDERGDADPLDGRDRDGSPSPGNASESSAAASRNSRRPGNAQPLAETARRDSERETRGDEQHDDAEIVRLVHSGDSWTQKRRRQSSGGPKWLWSDQGRSAPEKRAGLR